MKPETRVKSESEEPSPAKASEDLAVDSEFSVDLTDEEKLVMNLLKENAPIDLNALKSQTGLSNKKWDLAIKGLRKHNLVKVEKSEEGLLVELV